jgi:transcriptional regulator with XRE-family HTH domain
METPQGDTQTGSGAIHLRAWRYHQAFSGRELAKLSGVARSGVTRSSVARIEASPDVVPWPSTVRRLAAALGIAPAQLRRPPRVWTLSRQYIVNTWSAHRRIMF